MTSRILLVLPDAHETRSILPRGLSAEYSVSAAPDGRSALDLLRNSPADAVIIDSESTDIDNLFLERRISTYYPRIKILILAEDDRRDSIFGAFNAGVAGYLLKKNGETEIDEALRTILDGNIFISQKIAQGASPEAFLKRVRQAHFQEIFTRMELAVLQCIRNAMSNAQIAETLHISVSTVKTHKSHIMGKLGFRKSPEIIKYLIEHDILI